MSVPIVKANLTASVAAAPFTCQVPQPMAGILSPKRELDLFDRDAGTMMGRTCVQIEP